MCSEMYKCAFDSPEKNEWQKSSDKLPLFDNLLHLEDKQSLDCVRFIHSLTKRHSQHDVCRLRDCTALLNLGCTRSSNPSPTPSPQHHHTTRLLPHPLPRRLLPPASRVPASPSKWVIATGTSYPNGPANWGTNEVQTYTKSPSNINITSSGTLLITPLRVSSGPLDSINDYWTSARIETVADHIACPPGGKLLMSASLRFGSAPSPSQMGIWPSFWALGSEFRRSGKFDQWPGAGEIDMAESTNGSPTVWQSLHCGVALGGPCNEFSGLSTSTPLERDGRTFHVFAAEIDRTNAGGDWRGEKLTYLVDGRSMVVLTGAQIGDEKAWTAVTRMPKYLILNVAVGGDFPNNVANLEGGKTPNGKTMGGIEAGLEVEWVAAYST